MIEIDPNLEIIGAPTPEEILWQNLQVSDSEKFYGKMKGNICIMAVVGLSLAILYMTNITLFNSDNPYNLEGINLIIATNAVSILTLILNYLINKTILFTSKLGKYDLQGEEDFDLIWKTTLAQFLN